jgi:hypothetical protein
MCGLRTGSSLYPNRVPHRSPFPPVSDFTRHHLPKPSVRNLDRLYLPFTSVCILSLFSEVDRECTFSNTRLLYLYWFGFEATLSDVLFETLCIACIGLNPEKSSTSCDLGQNLVSVGAAA